MGAAAVDRLPALARLTWTTTSRSRAEPSSSVR
jgi:hypothetical protein